MTDEPNEEEHHDFTELEVSAGSLEHPRVFKLKSPHRSFNAQENSVMLTFRSC